MIGFGLLIMIGLAIYVGWGAREQIPPEPKYPDWEDE